MQPEVMVKPFPFRGKKRNKQKKRQVVDYQTSVKEGASKAVIKAGGNLRRIHLLVTDLPIALRLKC